MKPEAPDRFLDRLLHRIDELPPEAKGEAPLESATLEQFEVLGELGRGGMGVVYIAQQKSLRRYVALKFLPAHLSISANSRERIRREAQAISRLHHPHLVRIHAVGEKDGAPFLAMEFVPGVPLSSLLEALWQRNPATLQGPDLYRAFQDAWHARFAKLEGVAHEFSPHQQTENPFWFQGYDRILAQWARQIADALHAAHQSDVLHRDVKPSNILITAAGDAVLADFGLAWEGGAESMTRSEEFVGTLHYAAPEALLGKEGQRSPSSDIYSLGMVLYECLTLSTPFEGKSRAQTVHRIATTEPDRVRKKNSNVDSSIETICMKAIEKEPSWRYASAREMANDLDTFFGGQPVDPSTIGELTRTIRRVKRHPWTPWVLSSAAVIAGGLGLWLGVGPKDGFNPKRWAALPQLQQHERQFADGAASLVASSLAANFKMFARAKEKIGQYLQVVPDDAGALALYILAEQEQDKDIEKDCARLFSLFPDSSEVQQFAISLFPGVKPLPEVAPRKRPMTKVEWRTLQLCFALQAKNIPEAKKVLEEFVTAEHDLAWPRLSYGFACIMSVETVQMAQAMPELQRYLEKAPNDPLANTAIGFIYLNTGRGDEAGVCFEKAFAADPTLWPAQELLERWKSTRSGR